MRRTVFVLAACGALLAYLRDPVWLAGVTSGFSRWEQDGSGMRLRWMGGRASFFVSAAARELDIPVHAPAMDQSPGPFVIDVRIDDRRVSRSVVQGPGWVVLTVPVPLAANGRHVRRVDLYASRTWGERSLSVQVGEVRAK